VTSDRWLLGWALVVFGSEFASVISTSTKLSHSKYVDPAVNGGQTTVFEEVCLP
jgi:hypothetical protein